MSCAPLDLVIISGLCNLLLAGVVVYLSVWVFRMTSDCSRYRSIIAYLKNREVDDE